MNANSIRSKAVRRFQSGMVGIARGQTVRVNVVHSANPDAQTLPIRALAALTGNPRSEIITQSSMTLKPGVSTFLDAPFEKCADGKEKRHQVRATVSVFEDVDSMCVVTLEVFDDQTGKTALVLHVPEL